MTYEMRKAYAEVDEALHNMPQEYIEKIPKKIIEMLKEEKLKDYKVKLEKENIIDASKLTKTTMAILAVFQYQYWCTNEKVRSELYKIYAKNEAKYQEELKEKYNPDKLFKKQKTTKVEENLSVVKYKENIFTKLYNFVSKIFNKKN